MSLESFLDRFGGVDRSIVVVNRTDPDPVMNMLADTFGDDGVTVVDGTVTGEENRWKRSDGGTERRGRACRHGGLGAGEFTVARPAEADREPAGPVIDVDALRRNDAVPFDGDSPEEVENLALLVEDEEVVAGSTLKELGNAVLFVNSDLYVTGSRTISDLDLPAVITGLSDATFTLRGYPESNRQKLLLITISRFIERAAWVAGDGTLRSSFQRLSRIDDEVGTRAVYERVTDAGVDTHVYGVPDDPPTDLDAVVHGGDGRDFTDSWFVVYRPPEGSRRVDADLNGDLAQGVEDGVALLAVETEPRVWKGTWTFDPDRVDELNRYIERNL